MAKAKAAKTMSDTALWTLTILTLAISCAAMSMLISENQDLQARNDALVAAIQS